VLHFAVNAVLSQQYACVTWHCMPLVDSELLSKTAGCPEAVRLSQIF
jgi:hypothetical protein